MPTVNQLIRKGRKQVRRVSKAPALGGAPQRSGVVLRIFVINPKKPNSANRHCARIRLSTGKEVTCYIPGMDVKFGEHSRVLVQGGKAKDLPGVRYTVVRGTRDAAGDPTKRKHRSLFGTAKPAEKSVGKDLKKQKRVIR